MLDLKIAYTVLALLGISLFVFSIGAYTAHIFAFEGTVIYSLISLWIIILSGLLKVTHLGQTVSKDEKAKRVKGG